MTAIPSNQITSTWAILAFRDYYYAFWFWRYKPLHQLDLHIFSITFYHLDYLSLPLLLAVEPVFRSFKVISGISWFCFVNRLQWSAFTSSYFFCVYMVYMSMHNLWVFAILQFRALHLSLSHSVSGSLFYTLSNTMLRISLEHGWFTSNHEWIWKLNWDICRNGMVKFNLRFWLVSVLEEARIEELISGGTGNRSKTPFTQICQNKKNSYGIELFLSQVIRIFSCNPNPILHTNTSDCCSYISFIVYLLNGFLHFLSSHHTHHNQSDIA